MIEAKITARFSGVKKHPRADTGLLFFRTRGPDFTPTQQHACQEQRWGLSATRSWVPSRAGGSRRASKRAFWEQSRGGVSGGSPPSAAWILGAGWAQNRLGSRLGGRGKWTWVVLTDDGETLSGGQPGRAPGSSPAVPGLSSSTPLPPPVGREAWGRILC